MGTTLPVAPLPFGGGGDAARLAWILETIRLILFELVNRDDLISISDEQRTRFRQNWPPAEASIKAAIETITQTYPTLQLSLMEAGMDGPMLEMKADSLQRCIDKLYQEVETSSPFFKLKWLKPTTKCINTIVGSLLRAVPGLEVAKEYKDHLEVAMDLAEAAKSQ